MLILLDLSALQLNSWKGIVHISMFLCVCVDGWVCVCGEQMKDLHLE